MADLSAVPDWLGGAVVGVVVAVLGYVGKAIAESLAAASAARRLRKARLAELLALIRAGDAAFLAQQAVRDKLRTAVAAREPSLADLPYDQMFSRAFTSFQPDERELFDVVRAYTVFTFKPLNDALLVWLAADTEFRIAPAGDSPRGLLADYLADLEAHLLLWRAKYNAWIPEHPQRALVYLADESKHGTPFPRHGVALVRAALGRGTSSSVETGAQQTRRSRSRGTGL